MQLCISPHGIHESHKKDKVSAHADVTLLRRLSLQPPTQEPQEEA